MGETISKEQQEALIKLDRHEVEHSIHTGMSELIIGETLCENVHLEILNSDGESANMYLTPSALDSLITILTDVKQKKLHQSISSI